VWMLERETAAVRADSEATFRTTLSKATEQVTGEQQQKRDEQCLEGVVADHRYVNVSRARNTERIKIARDGGVSQYLTVEAPFLSARRCRCRASVARI
jgi:hypothetical protein